MENRMFNINKSIFAATIALALCMHNANAETKPECPSRHVDSVYLYYQESGKTKIEAVQLYQAHVEKLRAIAQGEDFQNFEVLSQDLAVNESAFGVDKIDATITLSMQFDANYGAVTRLLSEANASGFNSSRYKMEDCK